MDAVEMNTVVKSVEIKTVRPVDDYAHKTRSRSGSLLDGYQEIPPTPTWRTEPRTLRESTPSYLRRVALPFAILVVPLAFFVLGVLLASTDRQPETPWRNSVVQAANVAATLWPIFFAAVLGTTLKTLGVYMAEKGATLGSLQSLMASTTMGSTVMELVDTRVYTLWTPALLVAWALSPVGGQGVLRAVELEPRTTTSDFRAISYPAGNFSRNVGQNWWSSDSGAQALGAYIYAVAATAFSSPDVTLMHANGSSAYFGEAVAKMGGPAVAVAATQEDLWGNVRVPLIHLLPGYDAARPHAWVNVPHDAVAPYESLIGVPVRGIPSDKVGNASLTIQSSYTTVECSPWINGSDWVLRNHAQLRIHDKNNTNGQLGQSFNFSSYSDGAGGVVERGNLRNFPSFLLDMFKAEAWNGSSSHRDLWAGAELPARQHLVFATKTYPDVNMTTCELATAYVDTQVRCSRPSVRGAKTCGAVAVRHTDGMPVRGNTTILSYALYLSPLADIPQVLASYHPSSPGVLDSFLRDPPLALIPKFLDTKHPELTADPNYPIWYESLPMRVFESRLTMILNTYTKAGYGQDIVTGNDGLSPDTPFPADAPPGLVPPLHGWANTTGVWFELGDGGDSTGRVYHVRWGWLVLYMLAVLLLVAAAVVHALLRSLLRVPADFLQGLPALIRDTPFVAPPNPAEGRGAGARPRGLSRVGSIASGAVRARRLQDRVLMIRDVQPGRGVGRIALADADRGVGLDWERRYE